MKVCVEISDEQVVAVLQECVKTCLSVSLPRKLPVPAHEIDNLYSALEFSLAANKVIRHFGGVPVDLTQVESYPALTSPESNSP